MGFDGSRPGRFHCWWKWNLTSLPSTEASTTTVRTVYVCKSFRIPRYASNDFHPFIQVSLNSESLHVIPPIPIHYHKRPYIGVDFHRLSSACTTKTSSNFPRLPSASTFVHELLYIYPIYFHPLHFCVFGQVSTDFHIPSASVHFLPILLLTSVSFHIAP